MEGLIYGGKFAFENRHKFTVFALFYFIFEGNFPRTSPQGAYIWRGDLMEGFLRHRYGEAYIWRGLCMEGLTFGILRYVQLSLL